MALRTKGMFLFYGSYRGEVSSKNVASSIVARTYFYFARFGVLGPLALITPTLFSHPPSRPDGRRGRNPLKDGLWSPLSPVRAGGRGGRERVGRVRVCRRGSTLRPTICQSIVKSTLLEQAPWHAIHPRARAAPPTV